MRSTPVVPLGAAGRLVTTGIQDVTRCCHAERSMPISTVASGGAFQQRMARRPDPAGSRSCGTKKHTHSWFTIPASSNFFGGLMTNAAIESGCGD